MSGKFDLHQVHRAAGRVVDEQGRDFIYNPSGVGACSYEKKTSPPDSPKRLTGCLVGRILDELGIEFNHSAGASFLSLPAADGTLMLDKFEAPAALYLQVAQSMQDGGASWGTALSGGNTAVQVMRHFIK